MNELPSKPESLRPQNAMAEIQVILGTMHATGAMDEEGPFVANLMDQIQQGVLSPEEALKRLRAKTQSRNDYH